jgi:hypothetical protein
LVDREPSASWDFIATQYVTMLPVGNGVTTPYIVTGLLSNTVITVNNIAQSQTVKGPLVAKLTNVDVSTTNYSAVKFATSISSVGWDWKSYDQSTNTYSIQPKQLYFIKGSNNSVYKVVFTGFDNVNGVIKFDQTKLN